MDFKKMFVKAGLGLATFVVAYLVANPTTITNLIPENVVNMTVGGIVSAVLVGVSNWLKHKSE